MAVGVWWWSSVTYYDHQCARAKDAGIIRAGVDKWFWPAKCTAQTRIDYLVFEKDHMYAPDYDPEGLLSTLTTSAVTVCAGNPHTLSYAPSLMYRNFNLNIPRPPAP